MEIYRKTIEPIDKKSNVKHVQEQRMQHGYQIYQEIILNAEMTWIERIDIWIPLF